MSGRSGNSAIVDMVNHPPHYKRGGMEVIDVIEAFGLGFRDGNAVKYILRAGYKGDRLEDLKKSRWYLNREIERCEAEREAEKALQVADAAEAARVMEAVREEAAREDIAEAAELADVLKSELTVDRVK